MNNTNFANNLIETISIDIEKINKVISLTTEQQLALHKELDTRYNSLIPNFTSSMFNCNSGTGSFDYYSMTPSLLVANLATMRGKLTAYRSELTGSAALLIPAQIFDRYITKVNTFGSEFGFNEMRSILVSLTEVTETELAKALDAVTTIELILESDLAPHQKWENLLDMLVWMASQPYNVATCIYPLLMKI